jgi:choloylglycine hydrolase
MRLLSGSSRLSSSSSIVPVACTGISLTAKDGSYIQARTIEWAGGYIPSQYVIIPRGEDLISLTPEGENGLRFKSRYGVAGLSVQQKEFIVEGVNETGLSAGLFYFPKYGSYAKFDSSKLATTLADLQVVPWLLSQFSSVDEVKAAMKNVDVVSLVPGTSTVHWRIGEPNGRQVVMEIHDGIAVFYENKVGVITNSPDFPWQVTNLNNYVNLYPGDAPSQKIGDVTLQYFGGGSGMLGLPGDFTPPSRFVRIAFFRATAPQLDTAFQTVTQCFHLLNNFDVPIGVEHPKGKAPDIPSATQWTSAVDLSNRKIYYRTAYNCNIRCIELADMDFRKVKYQWHPLDVLLQQPVEKVNIEI